MGTANGAVFNTNLLTADAAISFTNHIVDASNEGVAWGFQAINSDAITHLGFRCGVRAATPPTYRISLQGMDAATGNPDTTVKGGGSPASATFTPPADTTWDGKWQWIALSNSYTPSRGEMLAVVIEYSSGTINGSNYSSFTANAGTMCFVPTAQQFPFPQTNSGGTWTKATGTAVFGVRTASLRYGQIIESDYTTRTASTVGHRVAMKFNLSTEFGSTFKIAGARMHCSLASAAGKNPVFGLWSASSVLQSVTIDTDFVRNVTNSRLHILYFDEATLSTLSNGTTYYLGLEVADAASAGVLIPGHKVAEAADLQASAGGTAFTLATYDGATWTDVDTVRPYVVPIFDDITVPSGGGGATGGFIIGG